MYSYEHFVDFFYFCLPMRSSRPPNKFVMNNESLWPLRTGSHPPKRESAGLNVYPIVNDNFAKISHILVYLLYIYYIKPTL